MNERTMSSLASLIAVKPKTKLNGKIVVIAGSELICGTNYRVVGNRSMTLLAGDETNLKANKKEKVSIRQTVKLFEEILGYEIEQIVLRC